MSILKEHFGLEALNEKENHLPGDIGTPDGVLNSAETGGDPFPSFCGCPGLCVHHGPAEVACQHIRKTFNRNVCDYECADCGELL